MAQYSVTRKGKFSSHNRDIHEVVMLADKDGNIINTAGSASNIPIAGGDVSGYSHINKFGYRDVIAGSYQTIWDKAADYTYVAAGPLLVTSSNTADDNGGTVEVQGLDENYLPVTEVLTIGGAASTAQFSRVFRALMITSTTNGTNQGTISIKNGATDVALIRPENGQTLMALYTIPAGKTGYLLKVHGSVDANNDATFRIYARPFSGSFNVKGMFGVFANSFDYDYPVPLRFEEKTDLEIRGLSQNGVGGGAIFDLILVDN